jgi:mRNA-degrading endonuclease RelE of RelBE toxin-antitoxin system
MPPAQINFVSEFDRDMHKLKRIIGLDKDLLIFQQAVSVEPTSLNGAVVLQGIGNDFYPVYKARKFRCKALNSGTKSGIRVIYTYDPNKNEILLIEIYYKEDKENNDFDRARRYAIKKI